MSEHLTEQELMELERAELDPMSGWTPFYGILLIVLLTGITLGSLLERAAEPLQGVMM